MRPILSYLLILASGATLLACAVQSEILPSTQATAEPVASDTLRAPEEFAHISNRKEMSVALFTEAAKVIESPRCMNCHPVSRTPTQGDDMHPHVPFLQAGPEGHGPDGLTCAACHQATNVATYSQPIATIPGNAHWGLAPASMAWQGKSKAEICAQLKDKRRNGNRTLAQISSHMGEDSLVGWAWDPGEPRKPAPGSQAEFAKLIEAWIASGAACPTA